MGKQLAAADVTGTVREDGHDFGDIAPDSVPIVKTIHWPTDAATESFARSLALQPGLRNAFIALKGGLGAGKTSFVRHLLRALGVRGRVKSPTYAVVEFYDLPDFNPALDVWHFDFYRFNDPREWEDAGFRDIFASQGLKLAEWPENAASHLPAADLVMQIDMAPDESRLVRLTAQTELGRQLLESPPP